MTPASLPSNVVIWLVGVIFGAGGAFVMLRQVRVDVTRLDRDKAAAKDLNGIGGKVRSLEDKATDRHLAIVEVILLLASDAQRIEIAKLLQNASLRR